ncbi:MAG: hypothetical protein Q8N22_00640 [bacterium]|nr:hypothetical protein [bacterium]
MNKKTLLLLIAAVLLIGLGVGGYFYWNNWRKSKTGASAEEKALQGAGEAAQKITESASQGTLPSIGANPLESKPDINPADKANPFTNIKTNPFE